MVMDPPLTFDHASYASTTTGSDDPAMLMHGRGRAASTSADNVSKDKNGNGSKLTTAQEEDDESILDAVSASKLKALEKELWNAASALVFRTEERDDAKQEIIDLKSKLAQTKTGLKSCKADVERLERENSLLLLRSDRTLGPGNTLEEAKDAMAALGTHNRQLTLSLWWACSALKLERERANESDDSEFGNYRSSAMGLHQKVAHHQQRPQEPEGVLANAMNAQVGMYGPKGITGREMTRAIKLAEDAAELMLIEGSSQQDGGKAWSTARGDMRERSKAETARLEMEKQREKIMKAAAEARAAAPEAFQTQQRRLSMAM